MVLILKSVHYRNLQDKWVFSKERQHFPPGKYITSYPICLEHSLFFFLSNMSGSNLIKILEKIYLKVSKNKENL